MKKIFSKILAVAVAITIMFGGIQADGWLAMTGMTQVEAAATAITSMTYYDSANGPVITKSGVGEVSYGFVMPKFNGKTSQELSISDVENDLQLYVKQEQGTNGEWKEIEKVSYFEWNKTWAWEHQQWSSTADGWVCWMKLKETTHLRFHGKTNNVDLEYTLTLNKLPKLELTSISTTEANITADATGKSATHWGQWTFNGDKSIKYEQVEDDITIYVDNGDGKGFVKLLGNADSGFLWDQNFGYYTDGDGGYWFQNINWSFTLRFQKKSNSSIYQDVKVSYVEPVRTNYTLTPYEGTSYNAASDTAAVGIPLPKIGGTAAMKKDLDLFKYEVKVNGAWISLTDVAASGWVYEGNGYNAYSQSQQWGYFSDTVFGLWFQPVKKNTEIRMSYPINGQKGGDMSSNYVIYNITGNPSYQPVIPEDMADIQIEDSSNAFVPSGWKMIWNDEFSGDSLDTTKWGYQEGYLLDENDINTAGWGNQELEYYTRDNVSVKDGNLNILMKRQAKEFTQKNDLTKKATAQFSSGKITTQNKFSVKYGRVDFRAKMPTGTGVWPAMWMLSNDERYGSWPLSGEIDVFEGRGRTPDMVFGTLHYGAQWPNNINTSDVLNMVQDGNKKTGIDDWHVYSVVWEAENIKIYCDGKCYFKCSYADWYSGSDRGNAYAPFDQRFYLILNLAAGGTFDSGYVPDSSFTSGTMLVDYVRVYQKMVNSSADEKPDHNKGVTTNGVDDNLYGDYKLGAGSTPGQSEDETTVPSSGTTITPEGETKNPSDLGNATTQGNNTNHTTQSPKTDDTSKATLKKTKVKNAVKRKNTAKIKITIKKIKGAKKYNIQVSGTKKFKKILLKKTVKKTTVTIKNRRLKNKKKLYVRARAVGAKKWSKAKRVKIKK